MRHLKFGIPIVGLLLGAIGLTGCSDENPWGTTSKEQGSINLTLTTDTDISAAKPAFRSEDTDNLNNYIEIPAAKDFKITLEKTDGTFLQTWNTLQYFLDYAHENTFDTGAYTLTAFYGEKGKQDFEAPYFEASASFNVLSGKTQELELRAELMNSMVKVNYTDAFKNYMSDFHSRLHTDGRTDDIIYGDSETRPAFIEPNNASLTVHFTTKESGITSSKMVGDFAPMGKTLHNVTFDIAKSDKGSAQLAISFDDSLEEDNIYVDLTDELLTTPAPKITFSEGYSNGQTLDMLANTAADTPLQMSVYAAGDIKSATLVVESSSFTPSWGAEIDLCTIQDQQKQQLNATGIVFDGFGTSGKPAGKFAAIDFTNFNKFLGKGSHKVSLTVVDKNDCISETAYFIIDSQEITVDITGEPVMEYCGRETTVTIDYNGNNPADLTFKTYGATGTGYDFEVKGWTEDTSTRAFDKKRYVFTLQLPNEVTSAKEYLNFDIYQNGTIKKASGKINVNVPSYSLEYDAFSLYAFVRVTMNDHPELLEKVMENMKLSLSGSEVTTNILRDYESGIISIGNLTKSTTYTVKSSITGDQTVNSNGSFTTEGADDIPNGEFKGHGDELTSNGQLQVGGEYRVSPVDYKNHSSISQTLPADWATVNELTAWNGSSNKNTWFIVPSSWLDKDTERGYMRNVGYNHNGTTPPKSGGAFNTKYYCENAPTDNQLDKAAGELFLGTYTFNGTETRSEGIAFASRPNSISFEYEYKPNGTDEGYARIKLEDTAGNAFGEDKIYAIPAGSGTITFPIEYNAFDNRKAAKLIVSFKSSNSKTPPPITIPTGSDLNEGFMTVGNHTIDHDKYHAVATGSELWIDNVTANYDKGGAAAKPARKTYKRK
ncbi:MAG: DUF4493 domain-containing protein [Muribaculaceae bacterium]|nr:DUF4493 domain-containing protein [Muribaculaceae bacterium]